MLKIIVPALALLFVAACQPVASNGAPHCHCCERCDCHQPEHTGASCDCTSCDHGKVCNSCDANKGNATDAQIKAKSCSVCEKAERAQGYRR